MIFFSIKIKKLKKIIKLLKKMTTRQISTYLSCLISYNPICEKRGEKNPANIYQRVLNCLIMIKFICNFIIVCLVIFKCLSESTLRVLTFIISFCFFLLCIKNWEYLLVVLLFSEVLRSSFNHHYHYLFMIVVVVVVTYYCHYYFRYIFLLLFFLYI